ncbi:MAG: colicin immunity domain-containing protein [Alphaproteobacteria bacterium]
MIWRKKPFDYKKLIQSFVNHQISANDFRKIYFKEFKNENGYLSNNLFLHLDWLFAEIDAYTDLPFEEGDDPTDHLTEEQLRASAEKVLRDIGEIK